MVDDPYYKSHWRNIGAHRMSSYRASFGWDEAAARLFEPADIGPDQTVADFGCGPGKIATRLAQLVGPNGHVHAIDINAEFLKITRDTAVAAGVSDRLTTHQNDGAVLPLGTGTLDRIVARNTLMYVDEINRTLTEFRRSLRPGGLAHAIDGDWFMLVAEPVPHDLWRTFVKAAAHACRHADMGRKLHGVFAQAGFTDLRVTIQANVDLEGRLIGMIRNMAAYAQDSGAMPSSLINLVVEQVEQALQDGSYLVVSPQFVVTGRAPTPDNVDNT